MDKETKKHVRIVAEKFNHHIEYQKDVMVLKSDINEIKLWEIDKYGINISYNVNESQSDILKVEYKNIYDIILELLGRKGQDEKLETRTGILLTIEEWINEEGAFAKEQLEKLKRDLQYQVIEFRELGGNRYKLDYYNTILILTDDLYWAKSNVIPI